MNKNDYIITHYPIPISLKSTSRLDVQAVQKDTKKGKITLVTGGGGPASAIVVYKRVNN